MYTITLSTDNTTLAIETKEQNNMFNSYKEATNNENLTLQELHDIFVQRHESNLCLWASPKTNKWCNNHTTNDSVLECKYRNDDWQNCEFNVSTSTQRQWKKAAREEKWCVRHTPRRYNACNNQAHSPVNHMPLHMHGLAKWFDIQLPTKAQQAKKEDTVVYGPFIEETMTPQEREHAREEAKREARKQHAPRVRCKGTTAKGNQCKKLAIFDQKGCYLHVEQVVEQATPKKEVIMTTPITITDTRNAHTSRYNKLVSLWDRLSRETIVEAAHKSNRNIIGKTIGDMPFAGPNYEWELAKAKLAPVHLLHEYGVIASLGTFQELPLLDFGTIFEAKQPYEALLAYEELMGVTVNKTTLVYIVGAYLLGKSRFNSATIRNAGGTLAKRAWATGSALDSVFFQQNLDAPFTMSVNDSTEQSEVTWLATFFGGDIHDARVSVGSTKYGLSSYATNPDVKMSNIFPIDKDRLQVEKLGKQLAKRNFFLAGRSFTATVENATFTKDSWQLRPDGRRFRIKFVENEHDAGDGVAAYSTKDTFLSFLEELGFEGDWRKWAHADVVSTNGFVGNLGFDKGHWHLCEDQDKFPFPGYDLVIAAEAFDHNTRLADSHANTGVFAFTPMKVKDDSWQILNASQLMTEVLKHVDVNDMPRWANLFLADIKQVLYDTLVDLMVKDTDLDLSVDEENFSDTTGEKVSIDKLEKDGTLDMKRAISREKATYNKAVRQAGLFGGSLTTNQIFRTWRSKLEEMIKQYNEEKVCALLVPATRVRTIATSAFIPTDATVPTEGSVNFLKHTNAKTPYKVVVSEELFSSFGFKFRVEYLDHDDGMIIIHLAGADGEDIVVMIKEPTSPNAGVQLPVSKDVASTIGTHRVARNNARRHMTTEEILQERDREDRLYRPIPLAKEDMVHATTPIEYAYKVADIAHRLGNMPRLAQLMALASRSRLWEDCEWAEYIHMMFIQASDAVDATVDKTKTISKLVDDFTVAIIKEIATGKPIDMTYLADEDRAGFHKYLTQWFERCASVNRQDIPMSSVKEFIVDGLLKPNTDGPWNSTYAKVADLPKRLFEPISYNTALLSAMANGPAINLLTTGGIVSTAVLEIAKDALAEELKAVDDKLEWSLKEMVWRRIAKTHLAVAKETDGYQPGAFARAYTQLKLKNFATLPWSSYEDKNVPARLTLPLVEWLDEEELDVFYGAQALPTILVGINSQDAPEKNQDYTLHSDGTRVIFNPAGDEDFDPRFAGIFDDEEVIASRTPNAKRWAGILNGMPIKFLGFAPASLKSDDNTPLGVFTPAANSILDILDLFKWEVKEVDDSEVK